MSLWFQSSVPFKNVPSDSRRIGFSQIPNAISPFSSEDVDAPQRTSAAGGVTQNFSSRVSIANNIDNSWNFDGPYFNDNSIGFNTEINNNIVQNYEINQIVGGAGGGTAGVTQIVPGANVTISSVPAGGVGVVTINADAGSTPAFQCTDLQACTGGGYNLEVRMLMGTFTTDSIGGPGPPIVLTQGVGLQYKTRRFYFQNGLLVNWDATSTIHTIVGTTCPTGP